MTADTCLGTFQRSHEHHRQITGGVMHKRITMLLGAAAMLGVSCGSSDAAEPAASSPPPSVAGPTSVAGVAAKAAILSEDFLDDRNEWGVVDDAQDGRISYSNGDYVW